MIKPHPPTVFYETASNAPARAHATSTIQLASILEEVNLQPAPPDQPSVNNFDQDRDHETDHRIKTTTTATATTTSIVLVLNASISATAVTLDAWRAVTDEIDSTWSTRVRTTPINEAFPKTAEAKAINNQTAMTLETNALTTDPLPPDTMGPVEVQVPLQLTGKDPLLLRRGTTIDGVGATP